jgi:hypothetical protein
MNEASIHRKSSGKSYDNRKVYGRCNPGSLKKSHNIAKEFKPPVDG